MCPVKIRVSTNTTYLDDYRKYYFFTKYKPNRMPGAEFGSDHLIVYFIPGQKSAMLEKIKKDVADILETLVEERSYMFYDYEMSEDFMSTNLYVTLAYSDKIRFSDIYPEAESRIKSLIPLYHEISKTPNTSSRQRINLIEPDGASPHPDSTSEVTNIVPTGVKNPANPNKEEILQLKDFLQQRDNLRELGWDLDDLSTWEGILWTEDAENRVQSIDISRDVQYRYVEGVLDLSGFSALEYLDTSDNKYISEIDLTGCNSLIYLNCFNNYLKRLIVPSAEIVNCGLNQLNSLDVGGAVNLKELSCGLNELREIDLSMNTELTRLDCSENSLSALDLSGNTALSVLRCGYNYLDIQADLALRSQITAIEGRAGALAIYAPQKIMESFVLTMPREDAASRA